MDRSSRPSTRRCNAALKGFKTRTIVFYCTDIKIDDLENSFLFMARIAKNLGHKIVIVTSHCEDHLTETQFKSMTVYQVGKYIPKSFWGYFYWPLQFLRSLYSTIWLIWKKTVINPAFIVVPNGNTQIIPILKLLGKLHVVQIETFPELERTGISSEEYLAKQYQTLKQIYAKFSDEIIVESKYSQTVFHQLYSAHTPLAVLYPCVDTKVFENCHLYRIHHLIRVPKTATLFTCFAPIKSSSNLILVIRAFSMLLDEVKSKDSYKYENLYLVIAGHYGDTKESQIYSTEIHFLALGLCGLKVIFLNGAPLRYRKSLLHHSLAVIFPMEHSIDCRTIFEANLFKRFILATRSQLAEELIINGLNGFILDPTPIEFYKRMSNIFHSIFTIKTERSRRIHHLFREKYGLLQYLIDLEILIERNAVHLDK